MPIDKNLVLGLDSSTTGCKAVVWDTQGQSLAEGRAALRISSPHPGWHEQNALDWWQAACQAIQTACAQINPERLSGMAISHQRESFVATDTAGSPLAPAMLWLDLRGAPLLAEIGDRLDPDAFHLRTGKPFSANLAPSKLDWLRREMPTVEPGYFLDTHAFLTHCLTGAFRTSIASADPLGLFDLSRGDWDGETLTAVGACAKQMPQAFAPGSVMATISPSAAGQTGLPAGLPPPPLSLHASPLLPPSWQATPSWSSARTRQQI